MNTEDFGFLGKQSMPEQEDFQQLLAKNGISYEERTISLVGTWLAPAEEVHYQKEGKDRYVYILYSGGADYSGQTCYAFAQPVPDDRLADVIERVKAGTPS